MAIDAVTKIIEEHCRERVRQWITTGNIYTEVQWSIETPPLTDKEHTALSEFMMKYTIDRTRQIASVVMPKEFMKTYNKDVMWTAVVKPQDEKGFTVITMCSVSREEGEKLRKELDAEKRVRTCHKCNKEKIGEKDKMKKCGKCKGVYYCTADCQQADWKEHKKCCLERCD